MTVKKEQMISSINNVVQDFYRTAKSTTHFDDAHKKVNKILESDEYVQREYEKQQDICDILQIVVGWNKPQRTVYNRK